MSTHSFDDSGGKYGYDPSSLIKSAVDMSKTTKVVKPPLSNSRHHYRSRSFSPGGYDPERTLKRSLVSRAEVKI